MMSPHGDKDVANPLSLFQRAHAYVKVCRPPSVLHTCTAMTGASAKSAKLHLPFVCYTLSPIPPDCCKKVVSNKGPCCCAHTKPVSLCNVSSMSMQHPTNGELRESLSAVQSRFMPSLSYFELGQPGTRPQPPPRGGWLRQHPPPSYLSDCCCLGTVQRDQVRL